MYFGKQLHGESFSLISSSLPLMASDTLIKISEEEFNKLSETIRLQQILEKRKRLEDLNIIKRREEVITPEIVEPNQSFVINEEDQA